MRRRAFLAGMMWLAGTAAATAQIIEFWWNAPGNAILLESLDEIGLEGCTPNAADNNCWILEENNNPGQ